ncbi:hypothetical protein BGZ96_000752 [Linnemannia gamsii]|uniref:TEA domain-containing protein n=1 Tax=Linnemannia gamsii TaxID=64522 RepID=A0ABQ7KAZ9_9FUNG|nr:hypothetical protein BGZ96_000752 [Linnemannia gamsii]
MYHQQAHSGGNSMGVLAKPQQQQRPLSGNSITTTTNSSNNNKRRIPKEKAPKGDREEVWPPEVENAFMKALEVLPKLGRRKVLVNGKPCGRNELIADFIYQETGKVRDRKQVSSHIQVLKNTRKNDPEFMKLLLDSGDGDDDMAPESTNNIGYLSSSQSPNATPQLHNDPLELTLFDSRGGMHQHLSHDPSSPLSAHPHGQDSYGSYAESMTTSSNTYYRQQQQQQQFHGSSAGGAFDPAVSDQLYDDQTSVTTPDSAISLSSQHSVRDPTFAILDPLSGEPLNLSNTHTPIVRQRDLFRSPPPPMPHHYSQHQQPSYPLWPTAFRLFTQYLSAENKHYHFNPHHGYSSSSGVQIHDLARLQDLNQHTFGTINIHHLPSEKFPHLLNMYQKFSACEFLLFKISMNLDLELEGGTFENSCLFESNDPHRTVRCSTLIYSFGSKVLESTEIKQAGSGSVMLGGGGEQKGGMGFQFVNQFFTAFLSGIRTLGTLDEVQVALSNLSIVQIYEEVDPVAIAAGANVGAASETGSNGGVAAGGDGGDNVGSPLLVMAFEFQQGAGSVVPYFVTEGADILDTLMC